MPHRSGKAIAVNVGSSLLKMTGSLGTKKGWQRAFHKDFLRHSVDDWRGATSD